MVLIRCASAKNICYGIHKCAYAKYICCDTHYVRLREEHTLWYSLGVPPHRTYVVVLISCASAKDVSCGIR